MQRLGNIRGVITPENLPDLFVFPGFDKTQSVWRKAIGTTTLEVDFAHTVTREVIAAAPSKKQAIMQRHL